MTVKQLIKTLSSLPQDATIVIPACSDFIDKNDGSYQECKSVRLTKKIIDSWYTFNYVYDICGNNDETCVELTAYKN